MSVSKSTAHEFIGALENKNIQALIEACVKITLECEEIWCYIDSHNKDKIYAPWQQLPKQQNKE